MNHPIVSALVPVTLLIAIGFFAGRRRWISPGAVKDLSNLVFLLLAPALLFRTMGTADVGVLKFSPLVAYFAASIVLYGSLLLVLGRGTRGAVMALAMTFSNTVMIGVPLVGLLLGEAGLVRLFPLISLHALILLTLATAVLEFESLREARERGDAAARHPLVTLAVVARNAIIHPVPLPILCGLLFAQTGLSLPAVIDKPLVLLGQAFAPLALVLVGVTLAGNSIGALRRAASGIALAKNVLHPLVVGVVAALCGLRGLDLGVLVLAASLPVGANVFLFSQRYEVAQAEVTAGVAASTLLGLLTLPVVMTLVRWL